MALPLTISASIIGAAKASADYAAMAARCDDLSRPIERLLQHHVRKAAGIIRSGERGLVSRTRALEQSQSYRVGPGNTGALTSNAPHGRSQQFGPAGGVFQSSRPGGYLAIPIGDNIGARGRAMFPSAKLFFQTHPDAKVIVTRKGNLLIVTEREKRRSRKRGEPRDPSRAKLEAWKDKYNVWFVLKKEVPGQAHNYATHDPEDQAVWDMLAGRWIMSGR